MKKINIKKVSLLTRDEIEASLDSFAKPFKVNLKRIKKKYSIIGF
jgi:hypothetical protein